MFSFRTLSQAKNGYAKKQREGIVEDVAAMIRIDVDLLRKPHTVKYYTF